MVASAFSEPPAVFPPALQKGDLVAVVFPSSFLRVEPDEITAFEILNSKIEWLQQLGYRTICYPSQVNRVGYLAGTDDERAEALMEAWKNEEVKAIWCFQGGYGSQRILDQLDYEVIKVNPKIFIGMSDITALHQAIRQRTGLVTYLAPVLNYFNEPEFDNQFALASLEEVLANPAQREVIFPEGIDCEVLRQGCATGQLIGGNLSLIAGLCGTEWQLNTEGKVLLLEDISESNYRIDRMLWQLKESGLLDKCAAVILSSWEDCKSNSQCSLSLDEIFHHYFKDAKYPVIKGFPSGHTRYQVTLPLNALIEIETDTKSVRCLESSIIVEK